MFILHIALGGCLKTPPVRYGISEDTGGHIAYVLGAAEAQILLPDVARVDVLTRAFDNPTLGAEHARPEDNICPGLRIVRLRTNNGAYLSKEDLEQELPALEDAFLSYLSDSSHRPDVVHAHFADAARLAHAAKRHFDIPYVYTPHSLGMDKRQHLGSNPALEQRIEAERQAMAAAEAIIVSSRNEAERQLPSYGRELTELVHTVAPGVAQPTGPVATDKARELLAPFLRRLEKPLILAIARPVRKKNLQQLVEAYATHPSLRETANLAIVAGLRTGLHSGGKEQQKVVRSLLYTMDSNNLYGHLAIPKQHTAEHIPQLYALAAQQRGVFVNPALHEPFGLTLVEAAAYGLPVVATKHGGAPDIVRSIGHGLLADPRCTQDIGRACHTLLTDESRWNNAAKAARQKSGLYGWPRYAKATSRIYAALARPRKPSVRFKRAERPLAPRSNVILACDLDDTLTGNRNAAQRFARWCRGSNMPYGIATGRSISEAREVLQEWDLPAPDFFITSVGSELYTPDSRGRMAFHAEYASHLDKCWERRRIQKVLTGAGLDAAAQPPIEQRPWKLSFFGGPGLARRIIAVLAESGLQAHVIASHGHFVDVLPPNGGKAAAIAYLARQLGLTLKDCIAAGNSGNDLDMILQCGRAVIVGNALPELAAIPPRKGLVHAQAKYADGVLEGLRRLHATDDYFPIQPNRPEAAARDDMAQAVGE